MPLTDSEVKSAIRSRWDVSSQKYDTHDGHGIKSTEERDAWKRVLGEALPGKGLDILDVGCGTGEMSLVLAEMGHNVQGLDLSEKILSRAREKANASRLKVKFSLGDAENLKFGSGKFDALISRHVLWTLPHPEKALEEWKRVVKGGGQVLIIDARWRDGSISSRSRKLASELGMLIIERQNPWKGWYPKDLSSALPHRYGMTSQEAKRYFESSGLEDVTITDLHDIREIQKIRMPFHRRVSFNWMYYMVKGRKNR